MESKNDVIISNKKPSYKISNLFLQYLNKYNRVEDLPVQYNDLLRYVGSVDVFDKEENNTLWQRVYYNENERIMWIVFCVCEVGVPSEGQCEED